MGGVQDFGAKPRNEIMTGCSSGNHDSSGL